MKEGEGALLDERKGSRRGGEGGTSKNRGGKEENEICDIQIRSSPPAP